jgi:hypothetical protein
VQSDCLLKAAPLRKALRLLKVARERKTTDDWDAYFSFTFSCAIAQGLPPSLIRRSINE